MFWRKKAEKGDRNYSELVRKVSEQICRRMDLVESCLDWDGRLILTVTSDTINNTFYGYGSGRFPFTDSEWGYAPLSDEKERVEVLNALIEAVKERVLEYGITLPAGHDPKFFLLSLEPSVGKATLMLQGRRIS